MPQAESAVVRACASAFVHKGFQYVDFRVMKKEDCETLYKTLVLDPNIAGMIWRNNTGTTTGWKRGFMKFGLPGSPDLIGFAKNGRWIGWEVKDGDKKLSDVQHAFHGVALYLDCLIGTGNSYEATFAQLTAWGF